MKAIWKFEVPFGNTKPTSIPACARIVHVAMQFSQSITFWAEVDLAVTTTVERHFRIVGTGHTFPAGTHIGTVMDGRYVWHLIDIGTPKDEIPPIEKAQGS